MALGISSFPISGKATQSQTPLSAFRKLRSWPVITILLLVAFLLDLLLPAGLAIPLLYVLAVVLLVALPDKKDKLVVATSCTILILVDSFFTHVTVGNSYWLPVIDHGLTVIMIWTVAVLGLRHSRAENALRQSEERFRALVQASAQIVWTTNAEGHRVEDSPSWRAFTGQSSDQSKGSGWLNAYHPDDHNRVLSNWRRVLSDKTPLEAQYRLRRHDGQWRWTLVRAVPLAATDGSLRGWVGMNTDITRRKQVEADTLFLLDLSECIRLAANADELLWAVAVSLGEHLAADRCTFVEIDGNTGRLTVQRDYHPHALSLAGSYSLGTFSMPVSGAENSGQTIIVCNTSQDERMSQHIDNYRQLGIGAYIAAPLLRDGKVVSALVVGATGPRDWSEREVALTSAVAERTWLAVEKLRLDAALRQSETALREADRRKDEFLATLAHELRNPLSLIRNVVSLIQLPGSPEAELRWGRDIIDRQVSYLTRLTDDLFDVSRITRNKIDLRKERIEMAEVVRSAVEASRPFIDQRGHEFNLELPLDPIVLHGDRVRLAQVIMNLLNNAAKYTPAPGRIWLTLEYESGAAVLRVKDTGIGIAAESLPHVFDLFYQVDRSFARAEGGLGLGLTLVRRLIEMHGGSVDVRSAGINRGSEFILRIPAWSEPCQTDNLASFETSGIEAATNLRRILVVDDFPHSATTLAKLLRQDGYEVRTAVDGVEALKVAASFQPDVIVLDIAMPRLDGYEVARRIRQQPWGKGTFLIALTGWGQRQDRQRTQEVGFDAHLTKPVNYKTLAGLLSKLAGGEQWQKTWAVP